MDSNIQLPSSVTLHKMKKVEQPSSNSQTSNSTPTTPSEDLSDSSLHSENAHILEKKRIPEINLSYEELVSVKTKDLNQILKDVPKERCAEIKSIRRTLKNRGYAAGSRVRSLAEKEELKGDRAN
uniref:Transcription factor MafG n=1 Tax=Caligus clemensi TaxID=344056 RepID=C1C394_CALCM|nr:Transcription factor MafG [Caligus clemensi]